MKKYEQMTKPELIRRIAALEKIASGPSMAFAHERLTHDLQVYQIELETQNRELREAQLVLETSRERFADLYDFAPVGYVTLDRRGLVLEANLTAAGMLGTERGRLVGTPFHLQVAREDLTQFRAHLGRAATPEQRVQTEFRLRRKGQADLPVAMQSVGVDGPEGTGPVWRAALTDISERKQAEHAAQAAAELNEGILSALTAHIAVTDQAGKIITVNAAWNLFAEEHGGTAFSHTGVGGDYLAVCRQAAEAGDADAQAALAGIEAVRRGELPAFRMEYPCHAPGVRRWFFMSVTPMAPAHGGLVIYHVDITGHRLAAEALRESEERFRGLFESMQEGCFLAEVICDHAGKPVDWRFLDMNAANEKIIGMKRADALGRGVRELFPGLEDHWFQAQAHTALTGEPAHLEGFTEVTGRFYDIHLYSPRRGQFACISSDITARRQAEAALQASEERQKLALEGADLALWDWHIPSGAATFNERWSTMLGYQPGELEPHARSWQDRVHPDDWPAVKQTWADHREGRTPGYTSEHRLRHRDGHWIWVLDKGRVTERDAAGQAVRACGTYLDISQTKRAALRRHLQYETGRLLAASPSLPEAVPDLLQTVAETFHWDVAEFSEVEPAGKKLRVVHVWHAPGKKRAAFVEESRRLSVSMFDGLPGEVLATRQAHWIADLAQCPHFDRRDLAAQAGLRSAVAFPITLNAQMLGMMAFLGHRVTEPDADLLEIFASVGSQIGQFMERRRAEEALREAHEFNRQVIAGAEAGIVVCDRAHRFVVWNRFMEQLTGEHAENVLGRPVEEVMPRLGGRTFVPMINRALAGEVFAAPDIPLDLSGTGQKGWVSARFAPWRDGRNEIVGVIAAIRDVTERRRLEAELLEISDHEQRRIGHDLHDDLCQQLAAIEFRLEALRHEVDESSEAQTEMQRIGDFLRAATRHARTMARVLSPVSGDPQGLMLALESLAANSALLFRVECQYRCAAQVPVADQTAAGHLYRIAQEAITNAVRHGHAERILLTLAAAEAGGRLTIADDGRGCALPIPPGEGMGTRTMQYRAEMIGATVRFEAVPDGGLSVICDFSTHTP